MVARWVVNNEEVGFNETHSTRGSNLKQIENGIKIVHYLYASHLRYFRHACGYKIEARVTCTMYEHVCAGNLPIHEGEGGVEPKRRAEGVGI